MTRNYCILILILLLPLVGKSQLSGYLGKTRTIGVEIRGLPTWIDQKGYSEKNTLGLFRSYGLNYSQAYNRRMAYTISYYRYSLSTTQRNIWLNKINGLPVSMEYQYPAYDPYNPDVADNFTQTGTFFPFDIKANSVSVGFKTFFEGLAPLGSYFRFDLTFYTFSVSCQDTIFNNTDWYNLYAQPFDLDYYYTYGISLEFGKNMIYFDRIVFAPAIQFSLCGFGGYYNKRIRQVVDVFSYGVNTNNDPLTNENYYEKLGRRRLFIYDLLNLKIGVSYLF